MTKREMAMEALAVGARLKPSEMALITGLTVRSIRYALERHGAEPVEGIRPAVWRYDDYADAIPRLRDLREGSR